MSKLSSNDRSTRSSCCQDGLGPSAAGDDARLPTACDRRRGDRRRRRDAALGLADHWAACGRARAADGGVPRGGARPRTRIRHGRPPPRAGRPGGRSRRRGDHDPDHVAGDGERDRPHRRDTDVRGRQRGRPQHRSRARGRGGDRADEGDPAGASRGPAVRSGPATRRWSPDRRGRGARRRKPLPRPEDRRDLRGHLLLPLRDEEHRGRRGRADLDEQRRGRRRRRGPPPDAPGRRVSLRHPGSRLQGEPLGRAGLDRARAARQGRAARRDPAPPVLALRRGRCGAGRHHAARARRARHARIPSLRRARRRRAGGCRPRRVPARARAGEHRHLDPLLARAPAHVLPRALSRPVATARRGARRRRGPVPPALAGALGRGHRRRDRRAPARPRAFHRMTRRRRVGALVRIVLTLTVTGACLAYILWQLDVGRTVRILVHAHLVWFLASVVVMAVGVPPMAWRWRQLLAARGVHERLAWLNRAYLVSYTAGQVLPTAVGGDASRIYETARRHPGGLGDLTAIVLLERALGGVATLMLAAVGFALAVGTYDVGAYLWIEAAFVAGTVVLAVVFFSRAAQRPLARFVPLLRRLRLERPPRAVFEGGHAFRRHLGLMLAGFSPPP